MNAGDKLLCKRDRWDVIDWYPDGDEIYGFILLKNKYYTVNYKVEKMDLYHPLWSITSELDVVPEQVYSNEEIEEYFYADKELRKIKLKKLNNV